MTNLADTGRGSCCPSCGSTVPVNARFCELPTCGAYIDWDQELHTTSTADAPEAGVRRSGPDGEARRTKRPVPCALLTRTPLQVEPGGAAHADLRVRNDLSVVDRVCVSLTGPAAAWSEANPSVLDLYPGEEADVRVTAAPPREPQLPAGSYRWGVQLASAHGCDGEVDLGCVVVARFDELATDLAPVRSTSRLPRFRHQLLLENQGNAAARVAVDPSDGDGRLRWPDAPLLVEIPSGGRLATRLRGQRRLNWWGSPETVPFSVSVLTGGPGVDEGVRVLEAEHVSRALVPRWLLPLCLAVATLVGLFIVLMPDPAPRMATVPSLVQQRRAAALASLEGSGLAARVVEKHSEEVPRDRVVATDPAAGTVVPVGDTVTVTVSVGPEAREGVTVPNVEGLTREAANAELANADLVVTEVEETSESPPGTVLRTTPGAGIVVPRNSRVTVYVSSGPATEDVPVPGVLGMSREEAIRALTESALGVNVQEVASEEEAGLVVATDPPAGTRVPPDTMVALSVSLGPSPTPEPSLSPGGPSPGGDFAEDLVGSWRLNTEAEGSHELTFTAAGEYVLVAPDGGVQSGTASTDETVLTLSPEGGGAPTEVGWEVLSVENGVALRLVGLVVDGSEESVWLWDDPVDGRPSESPAPSATTPP